MGARPHVAISRHDHLPDFDSILFCEFIIALIVRGHAHDRAGAVVHQNVIRHPERDFLAIVWIDSKMAGVHAVFFDISDVT